MSLVPPNPETTWLAPFDHQPRTRLVFGPGSISRAGELALSLPMRTALVVTDAGIVAAGHALRLEHILQAAGIGVVIYDKVRENPSTRDVEACVKVARQASVDGLIGLGGGSSMDTAKGCNFILTNGGRMQDYWGTGKATKPMLPLMVIPTTAGTGSECQSYALIADEETHQKMACGDPKAAARIALLDPELTVSQPPRVTACTGIDALAHSLETAVTRARNPLSLLYSRESFKLCVSSLGAVLRNPVDLEARGKMLMAAAYGGTAIESSMLGAAHSAANPLTAHFGIVHGQAVGMLLPFVVRFNSSNDGAREGYADLAVAAGIARSDVAVGDAVEALAARIESLLDLAGMPRALSECGVKKTSIPVMAREAAKQWTAAFNPRIVHEADFVKLYEAAFQGRGPGDGRV